MQTSADGAADLSQIAVMLAEQLAQRQDEEAAQLTALRWVGGWVGFAHPACALAARWRSQSFCLAASMLQKEDQVGYLVAGT